MREALLVSLYMWISGWPILPGFGWAGGEPMFIGTVVGLIYGQPVQGAIIGAAISTIYLGWISAGGAQPADKQLAGFVGTALALQSGLTVGEAMALAVPIGILGTYSHTARMTINSIWPSWQDRFAENGNYKGIFFLQVVPNQIVVLLCRVLPVFLAISYGPQVVDGILQALPQGAINGLKATGGLFPALGIGMLLKYMARRELIPFLALGFVLAAYGKPDLMLTAIVGAVAGTLYVTLRPETKE
jgi:mannose/fructose/N-acetylgalactosamine-specific phosphotransferase system component IIC